jgi:hypothetical protein
MLSARRRRKGEAVNFYSSAPRAAERHPPWNAIDRCSRCGRSRARGASRADCKSSESVPPIARRVTPTDAWLWARMAKNENGWNGERQDLARLRRCLPFEIERGLRASALDLNDSTPATALVALTVARLLIKLEGDGADGDDATPQGCSTQRIQRVVDARILRRAERMKRIMEDNLTTQPPRIAR